MTDVEYERERNGLIVEAEALAKERSGKRPATHDPRYAEWCNRWNRAFHRAMDGLARDKYGWA
jgi:hypothetical protein